MNQQEALTIFSYLDGNLYWKVSPVARVKVGDVAGTDRKVLGKNKWDYNRVRYKGQIHLTHRVIYLMHHGYMPSNVDHIDGNIFNNKIENLRSATLSENSTNKKVRSDSQTQCKNVYFRKSRNKYEVFLRQDRKVIYVGSYDDIELADLVAAEARSKFHGSFACMR